MKRIIKSDPFTGLELRGLEMANGNLIIPSAFDGSLLLEYDEISDQFMIPAAAFSHRRIMTLAETAEELGISRMFVSRLCNDKTIAAAKINGAMVIDATSVKKLKGERYDRCSNGDAANVAD